MAYALLVPYFGAQFFPHQNPAAVLLSSFAVFAVGSLARPVGAIVLGRFIDRHGRRSGLLVSVTLMVRLPSASRCCRLCAHRAARTAAARRAAPRAGIRARSRTRRQRDLSRRSAPEGRRGLFASTYQSSVALGTLAVAGLISILDVFLDTAQMESFGWRIVFAVGGLVALGGLALRRTLPETDHAPKTNGAAGNPSPPVAEPSRRHRADPDHRERRTRRHVRADVAAPLARPNVHVDHKEQAAHVNTIGSAAMLVASPLPRPPVRSHRPVMDPSPVRRRGAPRHSGDGVARRIRRPPTGRSVIRRVAHVHLGCRRVLSLPGDAAARRACRGHCCSVRSSRGGRRGFSPMVATSLAANRGVVAVGCLIAAMT